MTRFESASFNEVLTSYRRTQRRIYGYRYEADTLTLVAMACGFAAVTGIAAQIRVPLPFTPVPITLQTFVVLLAGIVLGMRFGGLSQAIYVGGGILGLPWFQGMASGLGYAMGPTGGYLVGFVIAAMVIGFVVGRSQLVRRLPMVVVLLLIVNFGFIYGFGLTWLYIWVTVLSGGSAGLMEVLYMGAIPFVLGDLVKIVAVALLGAAMLPTNDL